MTRQSPQSPGSRHHGLIFYDCHISHNSDLVTNLPAYTFSGKESVSMDNMLLVICHGIMT